MVTWLGETGGSLLFLCTWKTLTRNQQIPTAPSIKNQAKVAPLSRLHLRLHSSHLSLPGPDTQNCHMFTPFTLMEISENCIKHNLCSPPLHPTRFNKKYHLQILAVNYIGPTIIFRKQQKHRITYRAVTQGAGTSGTSSSSLVGSATKSSPENPPFVV